MTSLSSIADAVYQGLQNMVVNLAYLLLTPLIDTMYNFVGILTQYIDYINTGFNVLTKFIIYVKDLSLIDTLTWNLLLSSIVLRLLYGTTLYVIKLLVNWWHYLVP